jgi:acyl carrier protein
MDRVAKVVAKALGRSLDSITPDFELSQETDSLGVVEAIMALEDEFGLDFGEDALEPHTIRQIAAYVDALLTTQHGAPVAAHHA